MREAYGLDPVSEFSDISSDSVKQAALASVYESVDDVDLWVGGLSEDSFDNSMVGELIFTVIKEQFEALRDGDWFWYEKHNESRTTATDS